jgi:hypothetical protein
VVPVSALDWWSWGLFAFSLAGNGLVLWLRLRTRKRVAKEEALFQEKYR